MSARSEARCAVEEGEIDGGSKFDDEWGEMGIKRSVRVRYMTDENTIHCRRIWLVWGEGRLADHFHL